MSVILGSASVTFGNSTVQSTAYTGVNATVYNTAGSYTFTIPTGVTALRVSLCGGGGGGTGSGNGTAGGASTVSSGTQSISTLTAGGGAFGATGTYTAGGAASGGDFNLVGGGTGGRSGGSCGGPFQLTDVGTLGVGFFGGCGGANGLAATGYGNGGYTQSPALYGGGGAGVVVDYLSGVTPGNTLNVTVGAGGAAGTGSVTTAGTGGLVIFQW
jgi:hypothetical protein